MNNPNSWNVNWTEIQVQSPELAKEMELRWNAYESLSTALLKALEDSENLSKALRDIEEKGHRGGFHGKGYSLATVAKLALESHEKLMEELGGE